MSGNIKSREQEYALKQLMAYDFMQVELNLYLDTHPCDKKALSEFKKINKKAVELRKEYEQLFGPITTSSVNCEDEWLWINSPWPWEI